MLASQAQTTTAHYVWIVLRDQDMPLLLDVNATRAVAVRQQSTEGGAGLSWSA
jgi:hypothetical protein